MTDEEVRHLLDLQPYGCADPDCDLCAAFFLGPSSDPTARGEVLDHHRSCGSL
jgi:hypothetical protein